MDLWSHPSRRKRVVEFPGRGVVDVFCLDDVCFYESQIEQLIYNAKKRQHLNGYSLILWMTHHDFGGWKQVGYNPFIFPFANFLGHPSRECHVTYPKKSRCAACIWANCSDLSRGHQNGGKK